MLDYKEICTILKSSSLEIKEDKNINNNSIKTKFIKTMCKIVIAMSNYYGIQLKKQQILRIAKDVTFQKQIEEILFYHQTKE